MESIKTNAPVIKTFSEFMPEPIIDVVGGVTYKGYAPLGTRLDVTGWRITKTSTTGTVTITEYAQGTMDFISAWSERANYTYSR